MVDKVYYGFVWDENKNNLKKILDWVLCENMEGINIELLASNSPVLILVYYSFTYDLHAGHEF